MVDIKREKWKSGYWIVARDAKGRMLTKEKWRPSVDKTVKSAIATYKANGSLQEGVRIITHTKSRQILIDPAKNPRKKLGVATQVELSVVIDGKRVYAPSKTIVGKATARSALNAGREDAYQRLIRRVTWALYGDSTDELKQRARLILQRKQIRERVRTFTGNPADTTGTR